ncbi:hypothetical protein SH449x_001946 [Pirellulaceae bacterium SH449]
MKRLSLAMFIGAICLALGGQWFAAGQVSDQHLKAVEQQKADRERLLNEMIDQGRPWTAATGPAPAWLTRGRRHCQSIEQIRELLGQTIDTEGLPNLPISAVLRFVGERLCDERPIPIHFDELEVPEYAATKETLVSMQFAGTARSFLNLLLEPRGLAYVIHESGILVTTTEKARSKPSLAVYDLSFVTSDYSNLKSISYTISAIIDNGDDILSGSAFLSQIIVVDKLLVVFATEPQHVEIESFLARLAPIDKAKSEQEIQNPDPALRKAPKDPFAEGIGREPDTFGF